MADDKNKQLFLSLIYSFQMQTMMQLGKLANPMSGKIERELDGAQVTIDMLDMLKSKSKGNTSDDESKFLDQVLADLKLNFVEERDKEKSGSDQGEKKISSSEEKENNQNAEPSDSESSEKPSSGKTENNSKEKTEKKLGEEEHLPPQE